MDYYTKEETELSKTTVSLVDDDGNVIHTVKGDEAKQMEEEYFRKLNRADREGKLPLGWRRTAD